MSKRKLKSNIEIINLSGVASEKNLKPFSKIIISGVKITIVTHPGIKEQATSSLTLKIQKDL